MTSKYVNIHTLLFAVVILFTIFLVFTKNNAALVDYDEATYAKVVHESFLRHDFLSFTKDGKPWFEKPPLYFWLAAGSVSLFGENELALRLPSMLLTVASIILIWLIAIKLTENRTIALFSALILATNPFFIYAGRQVRMDVPVTAALLFSLYAFLQGKKFPIWYIGVGVGIAVGVLFKSVVGFLSLGFLLIYSVLYKEWQWLRSRYFWIGLLLMIIILLPWHIHQTAVFGAAFWEDYIGYHILERFENKILGVRESFYYITQLFNLVEPWFVVFWSVVVAGFIVGWRDIRLNNKILFPLTLTAFIFLVFQVAQTKLLYYLVPLLPLASITIAVFGYLIWSWLGKSGKIVGTLLITLIIGIALYATVLQSFFPKERSWSLKTLRSSLNDVAEDEKSIGEKIRSSQLPVYLFDWPHQPTLGYYADISKITLVGEDTSIKKPAYIIVPTNSLLTGEISIKGGEVLFQGDFLTLFRVS